MTNEEAKIKIGELGMYARTQGWDYEYTEATNIAIKTLEQEQRTEQDVLDKIRAEILQMSTISLNANDIYKADVLAIIDKYKAESEVKE